STMPGWRNSCDACPVEHAPVLRAGDLPAAAAARSPARPAARRPAGPAGAGLRAAGGAAAGGLPARPGAGSVDRLPVGAVLGVAGPSGSGAAAVRKSAHDAAHAV